jgi:predicted Ser/Thr protein kinase
MSTEPNHPSKQEPSAQGTDPTELRRRFASLGGEIRQAYVRNRRVMSFDEYFADVAAAPRRYARSIAQYVCDVFDYYGAEQVRHPQGQLGSGQQRTIRRFKLFDCPWDQGRDRLVGQEEVQNRVYRILSNFVREGRVNRLVLLHGPNGSAKSTFVSCIARALEHYSTLDEGALYRFNWIFPSQKLSRGIGFGGPPGGESTLESFAHLPEEMIDAKLIDELRDHPLLLIPAPRRRGLLAERLEATGTERFEPSDYIRFGELGHKNRQIFEALLSSYHGDFLKVLRHVQVERFYLSRRYREGAVTVEPQLAVDARARQITADRSLSALPSALQSMSLFEYGGDLVDANRGLIEFAELLKRPLEAYKYLLGTVEHSRVTLDNAIVYLDTLFIGSSNEIHLSAFKEIPEFQSFKGRLELVRVPYLLDYRIEQLIYDEQIRPSAVGKHIAPHSHYVAALWAVLTRMRKPLPEKYPKALAELVAKLSPLDKAELYACDTAPDGFTPEQAKDLVGSLDKIWSESEAYPNYEGRTGASPREIKTMVLNAAQNARYGCVSPLALFDEMEELVKNVTVYDFLKQEPLPGGFHENKKFIQVVRDRYLTVVDDEVRSSMGLVDETQYTQLFERYVTHLTHWVKKEKVRNPVTGQYDAADEELMTDVERTVGVTTKRDEFRHDIITRIGAWSIDHPNARPHYADVFPKLFAQLRESTFDQRKKVLKKTQEDLLVYLTEGADGMTAEAKERAETTLGNLKQRYGYCDLCARDVVSYLVRRRYSG